MSFESQVTIATSKEIFLYRVKIVSSNHRVGRGVVVGKGVRKWLAWWKDMQAGNDMVGG